MTFFAFLGGLRQRWTRSRRRGQGKARTSRHNASRRALFRLEELEDRQLLAVLPPAVALPPAVVSGGNSPALAVDPTNPQRMVLAYSTAVTVYGQSMTGTGIVFSVDGGATWRTHTWGTDPLNGAAITNIPNLPDPTKTPDFNGNNWGAYTGASTTLPPFFTSMNPQGMVPNSGTASTRQQPYDVASAPSVTMDRNGNVYLVRTQHSTDQRSGAVVFDSFTFTTNDLATNQTSKVLYRWVNGDPAYNASVGVNTNLPSYQDPDGTGTQFRQTDPNVVRPVYVAWNTNVGAYNGAANGSQNSSQIKLAVTTDQGASFTTETYVNTHSNYSLDNPGGNGARGGVMSNSAAPQIAFTSPKADGTAGGDLVFVWSGSTSDVSGNNNIVTAVSTPNPTVGPVVYSSPVGAGGTVRQAIKGPDGTTPRVDTPTPTDFTTTINITDPNFDFLTDLDVTLSFATANLDEYRVELIAPDGVTSVTLVRNRINARGDDAGSTVGFAAGTQMGAFWYPIPGTNPTQYFYAAPGTTFDSEAQRGITDTSVANAAPYIAHFRPEAGSLRTAFYNGAARWTPNGTGGQRTLNGTWTLRVTDNRWNDDGTNPPPPRLLNWWQLKMTSRLYNGSTWGGALSSFGTNTIAATATVAFAAGTTNAATAAVNSLGIAPAPSVAVDTTLGAYSPYQGRLYIAYTAAANGGDIRLVTSDNGGRSWSGFTRVNDDNRADNFSEGNRTQWLPTVAVDPVTGTVLVTYYDARHDASNSRSVVTLATSIDGGTTFTDAGDDGNVQYISPQTPLTQWKTAYDPVTRTTVRLEPVPITANGIAVDGIGSQAALAVYGGRVVALWGGNFNAAAAEVWSARATIAAGPRVVASDMGPITAPFFAGGQAYNSIVAPDGTRLFDGFVVTFDRPIDPASFTPADVTLIYRSPTTLASEAGANISTQVYAVTPLDLGSFGTPGGQVNGRQLASQFLVRVRPQAGVGTYSYVIGPAIQDKIRSGVFTPGAGTAITPVTAPAAAIPGHPRATAAFTVSAANGNDLTGATGFTNVSVTVSVTGRAPGTTLDNTRLTLISPTGQQVVLYDVGDPSVAGLQNLVNRTFTNVALTSGDPNGDWRLQFDDLGTPGGGNLAWNNLTFTPTYQQLIYANNNATNVPAAFLTQSNITTNINFPGTYVSGQGLQVQLTLNMLGTNALANIQAQLQTVQGFNNRLVNLIDFASLANGSAFNGTTFDDQAAGPITAGTPPYPTPPTYQPVQPFATLDPFRILLNGTRTWTLNVNNSSATNTGTLARWEIRITPQHDAVVLTNQTVAIPTINVVDSPITVTQPAGTLLARPVVTLNITYPQAPAAGRPDLASLQADLVGPGGTTVRLFNAGDIQGQNLPQIVLDDTAAASIVGTGPTYTTGARYRPRNPLAALNGLDPSATWTLRVQDLQGQAFDGTLGWSLSFVPVAQTAFSSATAAAIPVGGTGSSSLTVTGAASVQHMSVTATVGFPNVDNLRLVLNSPTGSQFVLLPAGTGLTGQYLLFTTFDDYAAGGVAAGAAPYTGSFKPQTALAAMIGRSPNGTWTLTATDQVGNTLTGGTIVRWSLAFSPPALSGNLMDQNQNAITGEEGPGAYDSWSVPRSNTTSDRRGITVINDPFNDHAFGSTLPFYQVQVPASQGFIDYTTSTITAVRVTVNSDTLDLGQLQLFLQGPDGTLVQLYNQSPAGSSFFFDTTFDDAAAQPIAAGTPPFAFGTFRPFQALAAFQGKSPVGVWSLVVPGATTGTYLPFQSVYQNDWTLDIDADAGFPFGNVNINETNAPFNLPPYYYQVLVPPQAAGTVVSNVRVSIGFASGTSLEELELYLRGPDGSIVRLYNRNYTGNTNPPSAPPANRNFLRGTIFDDRANNILTTTGAPYTGPFKPDQPLGVFNGIDPEGIWELLVPNPLYDPIFNPDVDPYAEYSDIYGGDWQLELETRLVAAPLTLPLAPDTLPLIIPGPRLTGTGALATDAPKPIVAGNSILSTVTLPAGVGTVSNPTVTVNLTHPAVGDLTLTLIAPNGDSVVLSQRRGGANANLNNLEFADAAALPVSGLGNGTAPFVGTFRPEGQLGNLDFVFQGGQYVSRDAGGTWTLRIDNAGAAVGTLNGWSFDFGGTQSAAGDNLVLNGSSKSMDVIFDHDMDPATFTPDKILRMVGPAGEIKGPFTITANPPGTAPELARRLFRIGFPEQKLSGSYVITLASSIKSLGTTSSSNPAANTQVITRGGTAVSTFTVPATVTGTVTDLAVRVNVTDLGGLSLGDLVLTLVGPGGQSVQLMNGNGGSNTQLTNVQFSDKASATIASVPNGAGSLIGTFRPAQALSAFNGRAIAGTWALRVQNTRTGGAVVGTLNGWTLDFGPTSTPGNALDTNTNAGFDAQRGTNSTGVTAPVTFNAAGAANVNVTFQPGTVVESRLTIDDAFVIQGATLTLNITGTQNQFLSALLIAPDGTAVDLFDNLQPGALGVIAVTFDDAALTPIDNLSAPFNSGPYNPKTPLSDLRLKNAAGTYTLRLTYRQGATPPGTLTAWSLTLKKPVTAGVVGENRTAFPVSPGGTATSTINVTENFAIQNVVVTLDVSNTEDKLVTATLRGPDGTVVTLFSNPGAGTTQTLYGFANTTLDDSATTPIQQGLPPFNIGPYKPLNPLSVFRGRAALGTWTLQLQYANGTTRVGQLNSWQLTLFRPDPGTGLGELVADQATANFRIFTMDQTNTVAFDNWTAVGPAAHGGGNAYSSRTTGLAVDPSDPSGNTVFIGAASGGVWKTTNFLTTDPYGPTWVPLTDFGQSGTINIGGLYVFARNNDPRQSIVFAVTGEGDTGSGGVGLLRSLDGGVTWELLDSTNNYSYPNPIGAPFANGSRLPFAQRDKAFIGKTSFKVVVDPTPRSNGFLTVYAVFGGGNGGVYRSDDTGNTWVLLRAGNATDFVLAEGSAQANTNFQRQLVYAAFRGEGVYFSTNRGEPGSWIPMDGGQNVHTNMFDVDVPSRPFVPVDGGPTPNGAKGRISLAAPALTGDPLKDLYYQDWLYALVATPSELFEGLYLTKDRGAHWTKVRIPLFLPDPANPTIGYPTNNETRPDHDPFGGTPAGTAGFAQGNYDQALAIDPQNPNVVYIGGTNNGTPAPVKGFIRVDTTGVIDSHSLTPYDNSDAAGGVQTATTGGITLKNPLPSGTWGLVNGGNQGQPYINLIRDPSNPFATGTSLNITGISRFENSGKNIKVWQAFDKEDILGGSSDIHRFVTFVDASGYTRIIVADDHGVFTGVDSGDGNLATSIGSLPLPKGTRNGNLQTIQMYGGAAQPSQAAADIAGALFYAENQDNGFPRSTPDILQTGNLQWSAALGDGTWVLTDQTGSGTVYEYRWPCCGGLNSGTDFYIVSPNGSNPVGRMGVPGSSLFLPTDQVKLGTGQWPFLGGTRFAVNPIDPNGMVMGSTNPGAAQGSVPAGFYLYRTTNQGRNWSKIALPNTQTVTAGGLAALAFGAPAVGSSGTLNDFIYAANGNGEVWVTFTGGAPWRDISAGISGRVQTIVPNPARGKYDAYAVTSTGVFYLSDASYANPTPQWVSLTPGGNLFNLPRTNPYSPADVPTGATSPYMWVRPGQLTSLAVDWRSVTPVLYVGSDSGVFRSIDAGANWTVFPNMAQDGAGQDGGYFPHVGISRLELVLGNVNPVTGLPDQTTGPSILAAYTYGRGTFAIRVANPGSVPGPAVVGMTATTSSVTLQFNGPVDPLTFKLSEVRLLKDPDGVDILPTAVTDVSVPLADGSNPHNLFRIDFPAQTKAGAYTIQVGPNLSDFSGNKMNQVPDGVNGSDPSDRYTGRFFLNTGTTTPPSVPGVVGRDPVTGAIQVAVSNGKDSFSNINPYTLFPTGVNWADVTAADYNGDGSADVAGRMPSTGEWWVSLAGGSATTSFSRWGTWDPAVTWVNLRVGDFNNDGRADLAAQNGTTGTWQVALSNGDGFASSTWILGGNSVSTWRPTWVNPVAGDFNKDGKDDIAGFDRTTGTWWVAISDGNKFGNPANWTPTTPLPFNLTLADARAANISGSTNANGQPIRADIALRVSGTNVWYALVSDGTKFTASNMGNWGSGTFVNVGVADFDGDDRDEIAGMLQGSNAWRVSKPALSGGNYTMTTFNWGVWSTAVTWTNVGFGDFDGDGRVDIAGMTAGSNNWYVTTSPGVTTPFATPALYGSWGAGVTFVDGKVADFSGDGKADIAARNATSGAWTLQILPTTLPTSTNVVDVLTGDFNGDGSQDIAERVATTGQWWVSLTNSGTTSAFQAWGAPWSSTVTWTNVRTADFDGDGKDDIIAQNAATGDWTVAVSSGTTFTSSVWIQGITTFDGLRWQRNWLYPTVGDFNKDGKADLAGLQVSNGAWYVALSNGTNFNAPMNWLTGSPWNATGWTNVRAINLTGTDSGGNASRAKGDIVLSFEGAGGAYNNWWGLVSDGLGSFTTTFLGNWPRGVTWSNVGVADFDGDGRDELAGYQAASGTWLVSKPAQAASGQYPWVFGTTVQPWGSWNPAVAWSNVSFGDFDGDGKADILALGPNNSWYESQSTGLTAGGLALPVFVGAFPATTTYGNIRVADFNGDKKVDVAGRDPATGAFLVQTSNGTNVSMPTWVQWFPQTNTWTGMVTGDFNGDGLADLAARSVQSGQWWVALSNGNQAYISQPWASWSTLITWVDTQVGDFNKDGLADVAARNQGTGEWSVALSDGQRFLTTVWGSWTRGVNWTDVQATDINGDGATDLVGRDPVSGAWKQSIAVPTTRLFSTTDGPRWLPANTTWLQQVTGDFNGDNIQDTAGLIQQGNQWWVSISQPGGGSPVQTYWGVSWSVDRAISRILVADFNGDGKDDIAGLDQDNQWWVLPTNTSGTGFLPAVNWTPAGTTPGSTAAGWWPGVAWTNIFTGDFNGDGKDDIAGFVPGINNVWVLLANAAGTGFQPTTLWTPAGTTPGQTTWGWFSGLNWTTVGTGDFNGDGKTDLIGLVPGLNNLWVLLANAAGTGFQPTTLWTPAGTTPGQTTWGWFSGLTWNNVRFADFNGDGRTDVMGMVPGVNNIWVLTSNGITFNPTTLWTPVGTTPGQTTWGWWSGVNWTNVTTGDFNGDGRTDVMGLVPGVNNIWVLLGNATGTGFQPTTLWTPAGTTPGQSTFGWWSGLDWTGKIRVGDFTGDGKADVLGFVPGPNNWWLLPANAAGTAFQPTTIRESWSATNNFSKIVAGDFNGDGRGDLAGLNAATGQWYVSLSNGITYGNPIPWGAPWAGAASLSSIQVGDFNGDGKADLAGLSGNTWVVNLSTGSGFTTATWGTFPAGSSMSNVVVLDLNGDGKADLAGLDKVTGFWWVLLANPTGTSFQAVAKWGQWSPSVAWTDVQGVKEA